MPEVIFGQNFLMKMSPIHLPGVPNGSRLAYSFDDYASD
jgi:hypothetical protein